MAFPEVSMHLKVITGLFKAICITLPYMDITIKHRIRVTFNVDSSYAV